MTRHLHRIRAALVSALGITVLLGTPIFAQADQGKWWTPKQGDPRVEQRERGSQRGGNGQRGGRGGNWQRGDRGGNWQRGDHGGTWQRGNGGSGRRERGAAGSFKIRGGRFGARGSGGRRVRWPRHPGPRDVLAMRDR